jgi:precorrin-6Y C5,15-methyltransferase (decarboxylating)
MRWTVVGIGADGWSGLDAERRAAVEAAEVVIGGDRHLAMLPHDIHAERRTLPSPLREGIAAWTPELGGKKVVVLASGDPLVAGIGTTLIDVVGNVDEILPAISSVALARARMQWPAESVTVLRDHRDVPRHLAPENRIIVLSANSETPAEVARLLTDHGFGASTMTVFENLGGDETRKETDALSWHGSVENLNLIALELRGHSPFTSWASGLPDEAFDHDGQLTKRDVRASALARLAPAPGQMLWDVGAGAGSIGIEWLRAHPTCGAIAIEEREDRSKRIAENAVRLGVGRLRVVTGHAPAAFDRLPAPNAIFVGGGATDPGVLDACWNALAPGGRLVVHGVTLETERVLADTYDELGGELTRLHVEHAGPIGTFTGWKPARAIVQWTVRKEASKDREQHR